MKQLGFYCVGRNNNFNLLRLIAASLVIFGHSYVTFGPQGTRDFINIYIPAVNAADLGVQIFFVISGFLIAQSFMNRPHVIEFLTARILRILPGLLVSLLLTIIICFFFSTLTMTEYFKSQSVFDYVFYNSILRVKFNLPGVFEGNSFPNVINASLWTLPIEFNLYIILLFVGMSGILYSRAIANAFCMLAIFMHLQKFGTYYLTGGDIRIDRLVFCFLLGVIFYANREHILISIRLAVVLFVLTVLAFIYRYYDFIAVNVCIAYLVFVFAYHEKLQIRVFRQVDYSYGMYIYAFPIQQALTKLVTSNFSLYVLVCFVAILPFAIFSWHVIERPMLRFKKLFHGNNLILLLKREYLFSVSR